MKILIVGAYPPPTGGNSVHVKRLHEAITANDIVCNIADLYGKPTKEIQSGDIYRFGPAGIGSFFRCTLFLWHNKYDIVHFHASAFERFIYAALFFFPLIPSKSKKILTIHSGQFVGSFGKFSLLNKKIATFLLKRLSHVITVNAEQKNLLEKIGVPSNKITVIPAYLPPVPKYFRGSNSILHEAGGRILIISSGYGVKLYGYQRIINAIKQKPDINKRVSLLLCLYNVFDEQYLKEIDHLASELESVQVIRNLSSEQFSYLLQKCDIYIRATDTDGDAVAIREAAYLGATVIASNAVDRPEFCLLFNLNDIESLSSQLASCLDSPRAAVEQKKANINFDAILEIYLA